jgi:hypothetical protein
MKDIDKLEASGALQIEDRSEPAEKSAKASLANTPKSSLRLPLLRAH